jgi:hypothetical protein
MSEVAVVPGCIFHWKEYVFADGAKANKYFIIVGAKKDCNFLTVIATSQPKHRKYEPGCNHKQGYYHIPGGRKDWFPLDTWLLLAEPVEVVPEEAAHHSDDRTDDRVSTPYREPILFPDGSPLVVLVSAAPPASTAGGAFFVW